MLLAGTSFQEISTLAELNKKFALNTEKLLFYIHSFV